MKETVEQVVKEILNREHILQLVMKLNLCLEVKSGSQSYYLYFQDQQVLMCEEFLREAEHHVILDGPRENLNQLFAGEIMLREAVESRMLKISCPFRILLALEAIFYLAKPMPI